MMRKIVYFIIGILLSIVVLLTSVQIMAFNLNHFERSFERFNVPEVTGMEIDQLMYTIEDVLEYFEDERPLLNTRAIVRGQEQEVFGERAVLHMIDVKALFIGGRIARNVGLALMLLLTGVMIIKDTKWKVHLGKTVFITAIGSFLMLLLLLLLMYVDFYKYFTYFHLIFFDNDLWILDPKTEILVQMVPEPFFYDTAVKIILIFLGGLSVLGGLGWWSQKKYAKKP
ncbi:integral membrane protein TIGR01906 [Alkaliphilus metalliredigens QYMF]|uniref:Integral membrane protein TIGR01906 n=1 Tax=Alkaliphilus metalliredigens (strain QYMF) TaxID=293826 RepID=A6TLU6_ALKMQ|nr:TIGR01906 family membrane protein [Alkaliphilus metalliredigens]ABR47164.1 integral membrane protein TIGR01906 [Alkaliphilus metalliredigens QYMF]